MSKALLKLYKGSLVYNQALTSYQPQTQLTGPIGSQLYNISPFGPSVLSSQESNILVINNYSKQATFQEAQLKYGVPPYGNQYDTGPYSLTQS